MPVYQLEEMPASELAEWAAHFTLVEEERKKAVDRAKRKAGKL